MLQNFSSSAEKSLLQNLLSTPFLLCESYGVIDFRRFNIALTCDFKLSFREEQVGARPQPLQEAASTATQPPRRADSPRRPSVDHHHADGDDEVTNARRVSEPMTYNTTPIGRVKWRRHTR